MPAPLLTRQQTIQALQTAASLETIALHQHVLAHARPSPLCATSTVTST